MTSPADGRSPRRARLRRLFLRWLTACALTVAVLGMVTAAGGSHVAAGGAWLIDPLPSLPVPVPRLPVPSVPLPSVPLPTVPTLVSPVPSLPQPSLPLPSVPVPSVPVPSLPPPSVSLDPLPLPATPRPTLSPAATAVPAGSSPGVTATPGGQASPTPDAGGEQAAGSATSTPSPTPSGNITATGPQETDPPESRTAASAEDDGSLALGDFVVPAFALGVSGLLVLLVVLAQVGAGAAILPVLRRTLGNLGLGRLGGRVKAAGDEPLPPA